MRGDVTVSMGTLSLAPREEWPDADFDFPEGDLIPSSRNLDLGGDGDEDWDLEMDVGQSGTSRTVANGQAPFPSVASSSRGMVNIRPPISDPSSPSGDDDDEGVSTIKVSTIKASAFPSSSSKSVASTAPKPVMEDDFEDAFQLPSDLTQLSLRPLQHKTSKSSFEWGDKEHTSSSASSDAYSSLGFGGDATSSNSATSASLPSTDDDDTEDEDDLDGLVIPNALFESETGRRQLNKILDMKKKLPKVDEHIKIASPDPEDNFEIGLVIKDDGDLSPSKLLQNAPGPRRNTLAAKTKSAPTRPTSIRPSSRLSRVKTTGQVNFAQIPTPPLSAAGTVSPPPRSTPFPRTQTSPKALVASSSTSPTSATRLGSLRGQKSHTVLNTSPPSSHRKALSRKASLSSLMEVSHTHAKTASTSSRESTGSSSTQGYSAPTAASRARQYINSTSRLHTIEATLPPSRPCTPASNPAALRLTLPTTISRTKSRPQLAGVFPNQQTSIRTSPPPVPRSPPRTRTTRNTPTPPATSPTPHPSRLLRRTKRRNYGDGTELDSIEDLPTDRDKEARFRVTPKPGTGKAPPPSIQVSHREESLRKKVEPSAMIAKYVEPTPTKLPKPAKSKSANSKKKANVPQTKRKPTLIRNLGGPGTAKVVGEMRWNPQTLRWEGNEQVLSDFDAAAGTSARPALITHLTGSSLGSPIGSLGSAARIVGNMIFDPQKMCWMSTLPPEEDEPDVFANMADDEEDAWESKADTIRAGQTGLMTPAPSDANISSHSSSTACSRLSSAEPPSPATDRTRARSESCSERGSRASLAFDVDHLFAEVCAEAEARHTTEMRGWQLNETISSTGARNSLYDIRVLATRQY